MCGSNCEVDWARGESRRWVAEEKKKHRLGKVRPRVKLRLSPSRTSRVIKREIVESERGGERESPLLENEKRKRCQLALAWRRPLERKERRENGANTACARATRGGINEREPREAT